MKSKLNKRLIALAIVVSSIVLAVVIVKTKEKKASPLAKERTWWVDTIEAQPGAYSVNLELFAQLESPGYFSFYAPSVSRVSELLVKAGDAVKAGDLLAKLDPSDFKPGLDKAKSRVNQIEAKIKLEKLQYQQDQNNLTMEKKLLKLKQSSLARQKKIHQKNLSSTSRVEELTQQVILQEISISKLKHKINTFTDNIASLQAQLKESQSELEKAELAFKRSALITSKDARIARVNIAIGDQVNSNQALISLYSASDIEIKAKLPLRYKAIINQALKEKNLQAVLHHSNREYLVQLTRLGTESNAISVDVYFVLTDDDDYHNFNIGEVGRLKIALPEQENLIPIPGTALYGQNTIYTLKNERLSALKVSVVGELYGSTQMLVKADDDGSINSGNLIVSTHLPNAISGLKVKQHKETSNLLSKP